MQGQISFPRHAINVASSSLGKDLKNYVYFSNDTRGTVGRAVKINPDLFAPFLAMVDPSSFQGRNIIKAITDLRATAGHLNSQANARNSFEYRLTIENVAVRYRVCSEEIGAKGTVYITQITPGGKATHKSGLYSISTASRRAQVTEHSPSKIPHSTIYLNGTGQTTTDEAADQALSRASQGSCLLAFSNCETQGEANIWKTSQSGTTNSNAMIAKLTEALEVNAGDKKEWIAEGEGVGILLEAIKNARGNSRKDLNYEKHQFSNYKFKLFNPVGDTSTLLTILRQKKAEFPEKLITYDSSNRAAKISAAAQHFQINQRLASLGSRADYNKAATQSFNKATSTSTSAYNAAKPSGGQGSTFLQSISQASRAIK